MARIGRRRAYGLALMAASLVVFGTMLVGVPDYREERLTLVRPPLPVAIRAAAKEAAEQSSGDARRGADFSLRGALAPPATLFHGFKATGLPAVAAVKSTSMRDVYAGPMAVQMQTDDPDVLIIWLFDGEEGDR